MPIIVIILFIAYCWLLFQKAKKADAAELDLLILSKDLLDDQELQNLKEKAIWKGMPKCLIYYSDYGPPEHTVENVNQSNHYETWYYQGREYKYAGEIRRKYGFEIQINNNYVIGWRSN